MFIGQNYGFSENHSNAYLVIKKKGITMLLASELSVRQKKRSMLLRKEQQLGQEQSEVTAWKWE